MTGEEKSKHFSAPEFSSITFKKIPGFFEAASKIIRDYEEAEIQEQKLFETIDEVAQKQLEEALRAKEEAERPRNFFMRLLYKPRTNAEIYGGLAAGNLQVMEHLNAIAKFNARQGHGFAAEMANNLSDRLHFINAEVTGGDNKTNDADRIIKCWFGVEQVRIQSKYCKIGARCIAECFDKNGDFRYIYPDQNGKYQIMQIEVPYDKYDYAVKAMQEKIKQGKVPGVTDPEQAKSIVRQGRYRYKQAVNIARGGKWYSWEYQRGYYICDCNI